MKFISRISRWMERNLESPLCQAEIARAEMMVSGKDAHRHNKKHGNIIALRPVK